MRKMISILTSAALLGGIAASMAGAMTVSAAADVSAFLTSISDKSNCEIYDAEAYMSMGGRQYNQGVFMRRSNNPDDDRYDACATFDVSGLNTLAFTIARIDDTGLVDTVLRIYKDGVEADSIDVGAYEIWKEVEVDVSDASTLTLRLDTGKFATYGLANFILDGTAAETPYLVPEYRNENDFMESAYDAKDCKIYDGSLQSKYMQINGRKYYQGIELHRSNNPDDDQYDAYVTFNVENVRALSFEIGRIDNTEIEDTVLKVYKDGVEWESYDVGAYELWKEISLDVSDASTLTLRLDTGRFATYGLGYMTFDTVPTGMPNTVPFYADTEAFMESAYDVKDYTVYDGSSKTKYMQINGRKYYQGIELHRNNNPDDDQYDAYATFNVENVSRISFEIGRIDNTEIQDTILKVYKDGEEWEVYDVGAYELWKEISLDVSDASTLTLCLDTGKFATYGLGNFTIEEQAAEAPEEIPVYANAGAFVKSAYDLKDCTAYNGSSTTKYMMMGGAKYYQGIELHRNNNPDDDQYDAYATFNVENVESVTFTLGRVDDTEESDTGLIFYADGAEWRTVAHAANAPTQAYIIDTTEMSTLCVRLDTGKFATYGLANMALDGVYEEGWYPNAEEIICINAMTDVMLGDVTEDGVIDIADATALLTAYAKTAVGNESGLSDTQAIAADANVDGEISIADATLVLSYYAYKATGGTLTLEEFAASN